MKTKKAIMIIDDEPSVLDLMRRKLEREGFPVVISQSGTQAIESIRQIASHSELPIMAILLDLSLEDMDGFEVLREIKGIAPELPVIMVTGNHDENDARVAIEMGALDYVTKPVNFDYLTGILSVQ